MIPAAGVSTRVPFGDLAGDYRAKRAAIDAAVARVLSSGWFILGEEVRRFEEEFAAFLGVRHVVACANGTEAIALALAASGAKPGDEVVIPANTCGPTVAGARMAGLRPVLADADPATLTLDARSAETVDDARDAISSPGPSLRRRRGPRRPGGASPPDAARRSSRTARRATAPSGTVGPRAASAGPPRSPSTPPRTSARTATAARSRRPTRTSRPARASCASTDGGGATGPRRKAGTRASTSCRRRSCERSFPSSRRRTRGGGRSRTATTPRSRRFPSGACRRATGLSPRATCIRSGRRSATDCASASPPAASRPACTIRSRSTSQPAYAFLGRGPGDFPVAEEASRTVLSLPIHPALSDAQVEAVVSAVRGFFEGPR